MTLREYIEQAEDRAWHASREGRIREAWELANLIYDLSGMTEEEFQAWFRDPLRG